MYLIIDLDLTVGTEIEASVPASRTNIGFADIAIKCLICIYIRTTAPAYFLIHIH